MGIDIKDEIIAHLTEFVKTDPRNWLLGRNDIKIYDPPLVGFASVNDPLFLRFKEPEIVGEDHLLPGECLEGAKTVISYFLPYTLEVRKSNREKGIASQEWISGRIEGEIFNDAVRRFLVDYLHHQEAQAIAPTISPLFKFKRVSSNWSERHIAFVAGLGTFGLHKHLITEKGCAGRFGSVVTDMLMETTLRKYNTPYEYCPWYEDNSCGACIQRCPVGAIKKEGKDKQICRNYLVKEIMPRFNQRYGCGKCSVAVPCEYRIPAKVNPGNVDQ
jgi:epoxyqueuosine reductase